MIGVRAHWKDGRVVFDESVDWPEGCELEVRPLVSAAENDREQPNDPQSIARWIAEFRSIPPLQMTAEEEAEWQAARQAQREFELKTFEQRGGPTLRGIEMRKAHSVIQGGHFGKYFCHR